MSIGKYRRLGICSFSAIMEIDMKIETVRHSLAHILAASVQELYPGTKFGIGPAIENGFYYDFDLLKAISPEDLPKIEKKMRDLLKQNIPFQKKIIAKAEAKALFKNQPYKLELIKDQQTGVYESGKFIDLCKGPHIKSTKEIPLDGFKLTRIAGAYWKGSEKNPMLTRIYGLAFDSKKELDDYLKLQQEAEKRDHRKLGETLDLFSFHSVAPATPFWHPKGMVIVNELQNYIRKLQREMGYLETSTPILVKKELYEISGHWEHYQENIFPLKIENEAFALKPMNCPESTYIYSSKIRSYKDLPLRLAEFGYLHRKEKTGVLTGLFRAYGFIQDDAHIYCQPDKIFDEITNVLKLLTKIHKDFNLKTSFAFATKPDKAMGDPKLWKKAENSLEFALKKNKLEYEMHPKDGAFYGPKLDVDVEDSLGRKWTIATIQLDFQIPERFNLFYIDQKGKKQRPVIIHRSSIGSFERFIGILLEHYAGALPFWLSPVQIWVIPIGSRHEKYAQKVSEELKDFRVEIKNENETVSKKIRAGEMQKIPFMLVVGDEEMKTESIRARERGKGDLGMIKLNKFIEKCQNYLNQPKT